MPALVKILVVDGSESHRKHLANLLTEEGYQPLESDSGESAFRALRQRPQLVIVAPDTINMSGSTFLKTLRENNFAPAVFVISAQKSQSDVVEAFDLGAADVLGRPYNTPEMLARIRRTLRSIPNEDQRPLTYRNDELSIDLPNRQVILSGEDVYLTKKEFELLELFVEQAGKVLSINYLLRSLWSSDTESQHLRFYISQLRNKIEPAPGRPRYLKTLHGVGYRLVSPSGY